MLDTSLPFPYQSDQQLADWQESQSSDGDHFEDSDYCRSFLAHTDAEGNVSHSVRDQIFKEHGSDLDEFIGLATVQEALNGRVILAWLGY
tara:strand:+ start:721 stop:990 length:270 start_codon:yes stop_codon:yes gene_type:complete